MVCVWLATDGMGRCRPAVYAATSVTVMVAAGQVACSCYYQSVTQVKVRG